MSTQPAAGRPVPVLEARWATPQTEDVGPLLLTRLRTTNLIFLGSGVLLASMELLLREWWSGWSLWDDWLNGLFFLILLATFLLLWWPRTRAQLRLIEAAQFGVMAAFFAAEELRWYQTGWFAGLDPKAEQKLFFLAGDSFSLPSFALIVLYGSAIPNTGRRCAVFVSALALFALASTTWLGLRAGASSQLILQSVIPTEIFWFTVAGTVAVAGSHRLSVLRREAAGARQLGQYRLTKRLGAGGMGEVYLAEHRILRRPCAVKLVRTEQADDPANLERFEREVQAMAGLNHPNAVDIYDYGCADDGTFYYAMEYLPGLTLLQLVEKYGPLAPARCIYLLRQVCGALAEAHAAGLIHRDVTPGNVIVCERGGVYDFVKLLDFGLVQQPAHRQDARLTMSGAFVGTPEFLAPEQAGGGVVDRRIDLYSLGAVGYFLLTGQPVFVRDSPMRIIAAHISEPVIPPADLCPELPLDLQAVILRCLEKNPARRYADASALSAALGACDCASAWSAEQAASWWKEQGSRGNE